MKNNTTKQNTTRGRTKIKRAKKVAKKKIGGGGSAGWPPYQKSWPYRPLRDWEPVIPVIREMGLDVYEHTNLAVFSQSALENPEKTLSADLLRDFVFRYGPEDVIARMLDYKAEKAQRNRTA